jgi:tRNA nucleotidyltransferase (CCA-adding enzyme)
MSIKSVLGAELERISLSRKEINELSKIAKDLISSLKGEGLRAVVGGSLAKGTLVRKEGLQDVDIFVVFDYSEDIAKLEKVLKKVKLPGKLKKVHGSRDYFQIVCPLDTKDQTGQGVMLEVIPVVKNRDPELAENVTDVSLSHVKYIAGEVKKNPKIAGEIRLAKAFARAQRCYGAEGYVRGFSGYSLEILVIHFGGFVKFLKGISKKQVVDPMKYFKSEREIMRELNSSKLQGPVVVVDPTYKFRNVCAGLGLATLSKFLEVGSEFLKSPNSEFFVKKDIDVKALRAFASRKPQAASRKPRFLELEFSTDRQEGDIAGTKMKKFFSFFKRELTRHGQEVLKSEFDYEGNGNKAKGYLVVLEKDIIERKGPSIGLEEQAKKFCVAKKDCFKRKGFWWCRESVSVEGVLKFVKRVSVEMGADIKLKKS